MSLSTEEPIIHEHRPATDIDPSIELQAKRLFAITMMEAADEVIAGAKMVNRQDIVQAYEMEKARYLEEYRAINRLLRTATPAAPDQPGK